MTDLTNLNNDFCYRMEEFDDCDISYTVFPRLGLDYGKGNHKYRIRKSFETALKYPYVSTSDSAKSFHGAIFALNAKERAIFIDEFWRGKRTHEFLTSPYEKNDVKFQSQVLSLRKRHQIVSECIYFSHHGDDSFIGLFAVTAKIYQDQLMQYIDTGLNKHYLDLCHYYLTRSYPRELNPEYYNGGCNPKAAILLDLISKGLNNDQIANKLHLSPRGVVYHIDRLQKRFEVNSKTSLIAKAKSLCLI